MDRRAFANTPKRFHQGAPASRTGFVLLLVMLLAVICGVPAGMAIERMSFSLDEVLDSVWSYFEGEAEPRQLTQFEIWRMAQAAAREHGVPAQLIWAIISVESGFDPQAISPKGAVGLMQLMPETAEELGVEDPFHPRQNIDAGARYLSELLKRYQGRKDLALAAYNAGPGRVARHGGVPPYRETRDYIKKVLAAYKDALRGASG